MTSNESINHVHVHVQINKKCARINIYWMLNEKHESIKITSFSVTVFKSAFNSHI